MEPIEQPRAESGAISDFIRVMQAEMRAEAAPPQRGSGARINLDPDQVKNGLVQLVLTLIKLLHELLERQTLRRIDAGTLAPDEMERIGVTLMRQAEEIKRLQREFGLDDEDLNLDLGPLGTLL